MAMSIQKGKSMYKAHCTKYAKSLAGGGDKIKPKEENGNSMKFTDLGDMDALYSTFANTKEVQKYF